MTTAVVFDIEAIPDLDAARRLLGIGDQIADEDVRLRLGERYATAGDDPATAFLKVPVYKIVSLAALYARREEDGSWITSQMGSRHTGQKPEAEIVASFSKNLPLDDRGVGPLLVSFNGGSFDLPLLRFRAFTYGIPMPGLHGGNRRDYWYRFGKDHIDLCDLFASFGALTKPSLAELAALAGIPAKPGGMDGSQVEEYVAAGRMDDVADYCLTDVVVTYCVFLRYALVRGELSPEDFDASMASLREHLERQVSQRPLLGDILAAL